MVKINWTELAVADLKNIFDYIAVDSTRYAQITVAKIHNRVNSLERHPYSGKIVPEFEDKSIRELISGRYRIIYLILKESQIDILRIYHSVRHLQQKNLT